MKRYILRYTEVFFSLSYQLRVKAVRTFQVTTQEAYNNVSVTVERNPNGPVLTSLSYVKTISQDSAIGSSVIQINASDADQVRNLFLCIFILPNIILLYFDELFLFGPTVKYYFNGIDYGYILQLVH